MKNKEESKEDEKESSEDKSEEESELEEKIEEIEKETKKIPPKDKQFHNFISSQPVIKPNEFKAPVLERTEIRETSQEVRNLEQDVGFASISAEPATEKADVNYVPKGYENKVYKGAAGYSESINYERILEPPVLRAVEERITLKDSERNFQKETFTEQMNRQVASTSIPDSMNPELMTAERMEIESPKMPFDAETKKRKYKIT